MRFIVVFALGLRMAVLSISGAGMDVGMLQNLPAKHLYLMK